MLLLALLAAIVGFALLVAALVTSQVGLAIACVAICVLGVVLLVIDVLRRQGRDDDAALDQGRDDDAASGSGPDASGSTGDSAPSGADSRGAAPAGADRQGAASAHSIAGATDGPLAATDPEAAGLAVPAAAIDPEPHAETAPESPVSLSKADDDPAPAGTSDVTDGTDVYAAVPGAEPGDHAGDHAGDRYDDEPVTEILPAVTDDAAENRGADPVTEQIDTKSWPDLSTATPADAGISTTDAGVTTTDVPSAGDATGGDVAEGGPGVAGAQESATPDSSPQPHGRHSG